MIFQVCAIYDSKARAFMLPMFFTHVDVARRSFADIANQAGHGIWKNPEDYSLHHVGEWDDESSIFKLQAHVNLGLAASFKRE